MEERVDISSGKDFNTKDTKDHEGKWEKEEGMRNEIRAMSYE
jgi:hypothetical protein